MNPSNQANCVAIFERHEEVEAAIRELHASGFDMKNLSIVGRDFHTEEHAVGFYNAGDRVKHWGKLGAFWGMIFGILVAPAFFWIPGLGPILTGGFVGSMLMGTIEGAVAGAAVTGGMSVLAATLVGLGIPKDSVIRYERALKAEQYLLIASGSADEVEQARKLLATRAVSADLHP